MTLRGTVYIVIDAPHATAFVSRHVLTLPADTALAFRTLAHRIVVNLPADGRLEFGPIAPSWTWGS